MRRLAALRPYLWTAAVSLTWALLGLYVALVLTPRAAHGEGAASMPEIIAAAAEHNGLDAGYVTRVAWCESTLNSYAVSRDGRYVGLFQFSAGTWAWASAQAGHAGASRFDAWANADTAAHLLARGGRRHWPVCAR